MSNPETILQNQIRLALGQERDFTIWRNTVGMAEHTSAVGDRYRQRFGLSKGSADLVGILAPDGRFVALEVKLPSKAPSPERIGRILLKPPSERTAGEHHDYEQHLFLSLVRSRGGFAAIVTSVEGATDALARARQGANE